MCTRAGLAVASCGHSFALVVVFCSLSNALFALHSLVVSRTVSRLDLCFYCGLAAPLHTACDDLPSRTTGLLPCYAVTVASDHRVRPLLDDTQAEEAKAIIPSLREEGKIDNDVLNTLLMELTTFAK